MSKLLIIGMAVFLGGCAPAPVHDFQMEYTKYADMQIGKKEMSYQEGQTLADVMRGERDIEMTEQGFVNCIKGICSDNQQKTYWLLYVNGKESNVGASEVRLEPGMDVHWDYNQFNARLKD